LIAGHEDGQAVDERDARVERLFGVPAGCLLRAHRQVAHDHVRLRVAQHLGDVDDGRVALVADLAVVLAEPVEGRAALHLDVQRRDLRELDGVVGRHHDRLGEVTADLLGVDIERGDQLDSAHVVATEVDVHQARHVVLGPRVGVVVDALHERTGAVAHSHDGDADGPCWTLLPHVVTPCVDARVDVTIRSDDQA
jgi:uncharacterized protein (DUF885 family)